MPILWIMFGSSRDLLLARRGFVIQAVISRKPLMPILWIMFGSSRDLLLARRGFVIQAVISRKPLMPILWIMFPYLVLAPMVRPPPEGYEPLRACVACPGSSRDLLHRVLLARRG